MKKIVARMGLALVVGVAVSANADQFRIHDYSEAPDVAWLTVNGAVIQFPGTLPSGGHIDSFSITPFGTGPDFGERMQFTYWWTTSSVPGSVYTKLMSAPDEPGMVSDEFYIWTTGNGVFNVDFISYDSPNGVMPLLYGNLPPPNELTELPTWQLVAQILEYPGGPIHDTFEVMSIPEPGTYSMILAGLGLLGVIIHRRKR